MQYPDNLRLQAPLGFRAALHVAAGQEGKTFSEFVREILQKEIDRRGIPIKPTFSSRSLNKPRRVKAR